MTMGQSKLFEDSRSPRSQRIEMMNGWLLRCAIVSQIGEAWTDATDFGQLADCGSTSRSV
jgi:hypothetical protein